MDREQFDAIARVIWTTTSRRAVLGSVLGAMLLARAPVLEAAKGKNRRRRKRKKRNAPCYPGKTCSLGPGNDNSRCNFADSVRFFDLEVQNSNLSRANLTGAQMAGANLRGVDLSGACLVGANLLNAVIDEDTNFDDAILCQTLMPDGSTDDSGCGDGTRCCPTPDVCEEEPCEGCTSRHNDECSIIGFPAPYCCEPAVCTPTIVSPLYTRCQVACTSDAFCQNVFGGNSQCVVDLFFCPYIGRCCSKP